MIEFRTISEASKNLYLVIERISDGQFFDWSIGAFSAKPTAIFQSMLQNPALPGRYSVTSPHQQLNQFAIGTAICFWMFRSTGDLTPSKTIIWMESAVVDVMPYNLSATVSFISITEPATTF